MLAPSGPDFKVGDHVWVVVDGSYVFERPVRIRNICERDGQAWAFVEGSEAGVPVDSLTAAQPTSTLLKTPPRKPSGAFGARRAGASR